MGHWPLQSEQVWLWILAVAVALIVLSQFVRQPGKVVWWLVRSAATGCLLVFAINWIGAYFHYHLPFNPLTAATAGVLGIPGAAALVLLNLWLFPA